VLGDRQATGHPDERRRRGHVDQSRAIAARAAAIGIEVIGPLERKRRRRQRLGGSNHFLCSLTLHAQRDQHSSDLCGLELSDHEAFEQMLRVTDRQILTRQKPRQRIGDG